MGVLANIFPSKVRAELFRLLFGLEKAEYHVRELERRCGLRISTIRNDLIHLKALELVNARKDGNRLYYSANTLHPLYSDIRNIVIKTEGIVPALRERLKENSIEFAFIFGSTATHAQKAKSDIDLMVIGNLSFRELVHRLYGLSDDLGREINAHVLNTSSFTDRLAAREHFITSVVRAAKIFITGSEDEFTKLVGLSMDSAPPDQSARN
jgi:predicted nucleotidyltransferase